MKPVPGGYTGIPGTHMRILRIGRVETAVPGSIRIAVFCALAPPVSAAQ